jgi:hypothetical protein
MQTRVYRYILLFPVSTPYTISTSVAQKSFAKRMQTGVLSPIISALENGTDKAFMMCADGKKITSGIDNQWR